MQREMRTTPYRAESCTENRLVRITCSTEAASFGGSAAFGIGKSVNASNSASSLLIPPASS